MKQRILILLALISLIAVIAAAIVAWQVLIGGPRPIAAQATPLPPPDAQQATTTPASGGPELDSAVGSLLTATPLPGATAGLTATVPAAEVQPVIVQLTPDGRYVLLSELRNVVRRRPNQQTEFVSALIGDVVNTGGQVLTGEESRARLDFPDGTIVRMDENTLFTLAESSFSDDTGLFSRVQLALGRLWVILRGGALEVETPVGTAAVRGSFLSVSYRSDIRQALVTCLEGTCTATANSRSIIIPEGSQVILDASTLDPVVDGPIIEPELLDWCENNPEACGLIRPTNTPPPGASLTFTPTVTRTVAATATATATTTGTVAATGTVGPTPTDTATGTSPPPTATPTRTPTPTPTETPIPIADYVWYGTVSNDWSNAQNWSARGGNPAGVPGGGHEVLIPAAIPVPGPAGSPPPNFPRLSTNAVVGELVIESGAAVDVNSFTLTINTALTNDGSIGGGGFVSAGSDITFSGTLPGVKAPAGKTVTLNNATVNGQLLVDGLLVVTGTTTANDDLTVSNGAVLQMNSGTLDANGVVVFEGISALTGGRMVVDADMFVGDTFTPDPNFVLVLAGGSPQTVDCGGCALMRMGAVEVINPTTVTFNAAVDAGGKFQVFNGGKAVVTGALLVGGDLVLRDADSSLSYGADSLVSRLLFSPGTGAGGPNIIYGNGHSLTVGGVNIDTVVFDDAYLKVAGGSLTAMNSLAFVNYDVDGRQLINIEHGGGGVSLYLAGVNFTNPVGGGTTKYLFVTDTVGGGDLAVDVCANPDPGDLLFHSVVAGGATITQTLPVGGVCPSP